METIFYENLDNIISLINSKVLQLINENFNIPYFDIWITDSDWDFKYIYEISFKQYLLQFFTVETEQVLSYYSQNLSYVLEALYKTNINVNIEIFLTTFINLQFKTMDPSQLFLNEN